MSYISNSDISERVGSVTYVQLSDDDGNGVADVGVVDEIRLAVEGEVNSYLGRRFLVPIDVSAHPEVGDLLSSVSLDLAEYRLRLRRPPVPVSTVLLREQAIDWLMGVADGRIVLPTSGVVASSNSRGILGKVTGESRVLDRDELSGF